MYECKTILSYRQTFEVNFKLVQLTVGAFTYLQHVFNIKFVLLISVNKKLTIFFLLKLCHLIKMDKDRLKSRVFSVINLLLTIMVHLIIIFRKKNCIIYHPSCKIHADVNSSHTVRRY